MATAASPSITGRIGVGPGLTVNPAASSPARSFFVFAFSFVRSSPAVSTRSSAFIPAATSAGGTEFENRYGRERFRSQSTISALAAVNPPLAPPSVLPSVPVMTSMRSRTPSSSAAPRPVGAEVAGGVAVVDPDRRVVLVGQVADVRQLRQVAVHAEDAVGEDQLEPAALRFFELGLQVGHVVVLVAEPLGLAEPHAVDDRGVVQFVGEDRVLLGEQRLEQPAVGVEAGDVEDAVGLAEELGDLLFEPACGRPACRR